MEIEVVTHAGGVTICAVYPEVPGELPNVCVPGSNSRMNTRDNDVEVTSWVVVPAGSGQTPQACSNGTRSFSNM